MIPDMDAVIAENNWSPTTWERLVAKREIQGECWIFTGSGTVDGYGSLYVGPGRGQRQRVHRLAYMLFVGPIPEDKVLDHLCRNRACFNPDHLEPVTVGENTIRGIGPELLQNGDRCRNGKHPWPASARLCPDGYVRCRECKRERNRALPAPQAIDQAWSDGYAAGLEAARAQPEGTERVEWGVLADGMVLRGTHDLFTEATAREAIGTTVRRTVAEFAPVVGEWRSVEEEGVSRNNAPDDSGFRAEGGGDDE